MNEYETVLNQWASQHVPDDHTVTRVAIHYDEGYRYSTYTFEDPHVDLHIHYQDSDGVKYTNRYADLDSMGDLLTQLFAIAEGNNSA